MAALAESLQSNTSLTELRLPDLPNLTAFIAPLAVALQRRGGRSALRKLDLGDSAIGPSDVTALINLLRGANSLERLSFGEGSFSAPDAAALAQAIGISSLTRLDLSHSLGNARLAALVPGLCCPGLRKLSLRYCELTQRSAHCDACNNGPVC